MPRELIGDTIVLTQCNMIGCAPATRLHSHNVSINDTFSKPNEDRPMNDQRAVHEQISDRADEILKAWRDEGHVITEALANAAMRQAEQEFGV